MLGVHPLFSTMETMLMTLIQLVGALFWAYVTAQLVDIISNAHCFLICASFLYADRTSPNMDGGQVDIISNANPDATNFKQTMDNLNRFCDFNKVDDVMSRELREYYFETRQLLAANARQEICKGLSPALKEKVAMRLNEKWLKKVVSHIRKLKAAGLGAVITCLHRFASQRGATGAHHSYIRAGCLLPRAPHPRRPRAEAHPVRAGRRRVHRPGGIA